MKFTVSKSALESALSLVKQAIDQSTTLAHLSGVYIDAFDGTLVLQTTNLNTSIRHTCAALVEEDGQAVLPGILMLDIVKNLPDAPITVELQGTGSALLTCEHSQFNLRALSAAEFPEFPEFGLQKTVDLPCKVLKEMVSKVHRAASKDETRPLLSSILMKIEDNVIRFVATDSYRLAVCDTHIETSSLEGSFEAVVNSSTIHNILNTVTTPSITIGTNENQIVFIFGNTTFVCRKIEGNYPNYQKLLPQSCKTTITFNPNELAAAINRVCVIAKSNPSVKLEIDSEAQLLKLSAYSHEYGESSEVIPVKAEGDSTVIALNNAYVKDCLTACKEVDELYLELNSQTQPGVFKSYAAINYLYLLMPVRLPQRG